MFAALGIIYLMAIPVDVDFFVVARGSPVWLREHHHYMQFMRRVGDYYAAVRAQYIKGEASEYDSDARWCLCLIVCVFVFVFKYRDFLRVCIYWVDATAGGGEMAEAMESNRTRSASKQTHLHHLLRKHVSNRLRCSALRRTAKGSWCVCLCVCRWVGELVARMYGWPAHIHVIPKVERRKFVCANSERAHRPRTAITFVGAALLAALGTCEGCSLCCWILYVENINCLYTNLINWLCYSCVLQCEYRNFATES